ncbi:MAG: glycosyltransferase family 2 protein [Terriglobia bacterium]
MPPISATIITRNEAKSIARVIHSLEFADEILVVDAESADDTCHIAAGLGARVLVAPWKGFAAQKNFAAREARHDWILSLDADEELNSVAQASVRTWKASEPAAEGYRFARRARYLGRWIAHSGWYPDYKIRLYHRGRCRWVGDFVHESVAVEGRVQKLAGEILHYTCDSLDDHRQRIEFYTDLAAAEIMSGGASPSAPQRLAEPPWAFVRSYFLRLGFLDGVEGFWIARMAARYVARRNEKCARLVAREKGSH